MRWSGRGGSANANPSNPSMWFLHETGTRLRDRPDRSAGAESSGGDRAYGLLAVSGLATDRLVTAAGQRGVAVLAAGDVDSPRLGLLGDRDGQREHSVVVVGRDRFEVQSVADDQLARVGADGTFGDQVDGVLRCGGRALGAHRQSVVLLG